MPTASVVMMRLIVNHVWRNPGCRISEIMGVTGATYPQVQQAIFQKLIEDKSERPPATIYGVEQE